MFEHRLLQMIAYRDEHTTRSKRKFTRKHKQQNEFTEKNGRNVGDESSSGLEKIEIEFV